MIPEPVRSSSGATNSDAVSFNSNFRPSMRSMRSRFSDSAYAAASFVEITPSRSRSIKVITCSATATPGVRLICSRTLLGSMATSVACRYWSSDARKRRTEPQATRAAAANDRLRWSPPPPFYSVIVRWIAINRVDVLCRVAAQPLRGVFDDYRRPLDSKVSGAALFFWAAPREVSFGDILSHLVHFRFRDGFVHDAGPFAGEIQQHLVLLLGQVRAFDSFRLNRLPVATGPEYKVAHLKAKDGLLALRLVKRT